MMNRLQRVKLSAEAACNFALLFLCKSRQVHYGALFISGTEGDFFGRSFAEFSTSPSGPRLLKERPDTRAILTDLRRLAGCPTGSLGRLYFEFMRDNGLDEGFYQTDVLRSLVLAAKDAEHAWYRNRIGNHHDLYHVLSGYGPDALGEAALMIFRSGQTQHRGVLVLGVAMTLRHILRPRSVACILEAYRRGSRAIKLEILPWEECLELPLATARSRLCIAPSKRCPPSTSYAPDAYVDRLMEPWQAASDATAKPPRTIVPLAVRELG